MILNRLTRLEGGPEKAGVGSPSTIDAKPNALPGSNRIAELAAPTPGVPPWNVTVLLGWFPLSVGIGRRQYRQPMYGNTLELASQRGFAEEWAASPESWGRKCIPATDRRISVGAPLRGNFRKLDGVYSFLSITYAFYSVVALPTILESMHYKRAPVLQKEALVPAQPAGALPPHPQDLALWCHSRLGVSASRQRKGDAAASPCIGRGH